ncbi:MAG: PilZ domain-containing protein [Thermodesulfovibrionales bacterium]|nr:PilZ domain-containing protein [Thermodesulfovibrionales bacterium]
MPLRFLSSQYDIIINLSTMTQEQDRFIQMREFSRVDAQIPFEFRVVSSDEVERAFSRVAADTTITYFSTPKEHEDRVLAEWLKLINNKLDSIIMLLTFHREGFSTLPYKDVNISGGGMSFYSKEHYDIGTVLELKMLLPMFPPVAMYVYGEVVKSESHEDKWLIGVKFIKIEEEIRDEIVRFVFKRQRETLRERRK